MLAADGDLVVFADADMATPPDQLPLLVASLWDHDVASAAGSSRRVATCAARSRAIAGCWARSSTWRLDLGVGPVKDTQCGFKGFTREPPRTCSAPALVTSIVFDVELIYLARRRGYRIAVVPIQWSDKRGSRMRSPAGPALQVAWDLFRIPLMHRRG
jgi:dolichyl-phosphate beta-glucosyltransferase